MRFKTRSTRAEDLRPCRYLLSDRHHYDEDELDLLIRFWNDLIASGSAYSGVAIDCAENTIIAFSVSIFVSDELATQIHAGAMPYVGKQIFMQWREGRRLFLHDAEIGEKNASSGVNVVTIHSGYRPFASIEEYADLRISLVHVFVREHTGLHIRSFAHELFGEYQDAVSVGGLRIHEYDPNVHVTVRRDLSGRRPFLTSLCRDGAAGQRGNYLSDTMAFAFSTPRFCFGSLQRQLLRVALENSSDEEIAARLCLSLPAVKKRWATIYDKIDEIEPGLLGHEERTAGRRGLERRRKVIAYLHDYPEELHAFSKVPVTTI